MTLLLTTANRFCRGCIEKWTAGKTDANRRCPTCRCIMDTLVPSRSAAAAIDALVLRCPRGGGCTWTGPLSDLAAHGSTCAAVLVPCKWAACSVRTARSAADAHAAICEHQQSFCRKCSDVLNGEDAITTHAASCTGASVPCPNAGCSGTARRCDLDLHRAACMFEMISCSVPGCGARFKRSETDAHHTAAAGTHNAALIDMVQTMSSNMTSLNRSLQALNGSIQTLSRAVPALTASFAATEKRHAKDKAPPKPPSKRKRSPT